MNEYPLSSTITQFRGLYDRGNEVEIPPGYFSDCLNVQAQGEGIRSRPGFLSLQTLGFTCVRAYVYKRTGEAPRYLLLDNTGNIYDSLSLGSPILSIASMTDFACVVMFNRAYISPHNGVKGLPGESVYTYDGSGVARVAAGARPSGTLVASVSATAGNIEKGTHIFAVAFETSSGHITKAGPTLFATVTVDGTRSVDLSGIPTGPSGTAKRHILATKFIETYDGNQEGYEFFFVSSATINNNTATTATVNFYDSQLITSADYLFDQLETIPAGVFLTQYGDSLVVGGFDTQESFFRVSRAQYPEAFDALEGIRVVDPNEAGGLTNAIVFRDSLYLTKSHRTYVTSNNGLSCINWSIVIVDGGGGTECHGIASMLDSSKANIESFIIATRAGAHLFTGAYSVPELSYNIDAIWKRINPLYFNKITVAQDPTNKMVYFAVPLDAATSPSHILAMDYKNGLSYNSIRWYLWKTFSAPTTVLVDVNNTTDVVTTRIINSKVLELTSSEVNDESINAIESFIETSGIRFDNSGMVYHFGGFRGSILGSGTLLVTARGLNNSNSTSYNNYILEANPGYEILRRLNFENERLKLKLRVNSASNWFQITKLAIFGIFSAAERPQ